MPGRARDGEGTSEKAQGSFGSLACALAVALASFDCAQDAEDRRSVTASVFFVISVVQTVDSYSSQPIRRGLRRYWSASGELEKRMFGASQYNFSPRRIAAHPNSTISVSGPATSKFDAGAGPPLQAASHSA